MLKNKYVNWFVKMVLKLCLVLIQATLTLNPYTLPILGTCSTKFYCILNFVTKILNYSFSMAISASNWCE